MPSFAEIKTSVQLWLERTETAVIDKIVQFGQRNLEDSIKIPPMEFFVSSLSAPSGLAITLSTTAGTLTNATTYYYVITGVNSFGETTESSEVSRLTTAALESNELSWTALDGADSYNIYVNTASGGNLLIGSSTTTLFTHSSGTGTGAFPSTNTTTTLASGINEINTPSDYLELIYLSLIDPTTSIREVIMDRVWNKQQAGSIRDLASTNTGTPQQLTLRDDKFVFDKFTDKAYTVEMLYYRRLPTLVNNADTNFWTSNDGEKAIIYASLVEFGPFLGDTIGEDPRNKTWGIKLKEEKNKLESRYNRENISGQKTLFNNSPNTFFNAGKTWR